MLPPFAETYSTIHVATFAERYSTIIYVASFCRDIFYYWNTCLLLQRHILLLEHLPPFAETYSTIGTLATFCRDIFYYWNTCLLCRDIFYYWNTCLLLQRHILLLEHTHRTSIVIVSLTPYSCHHHIY